MQLGQYFYRITEGVGIEETFQCGTVTAASMEEAADIAAKQAGLEKTIISNAGDFARVYWAKDARKFCVYVRHNPSL